MDGWSGSPAVEKQLWTLAEQYTPEQHVAEYTQAMMDLGALICTRTQPKCTECPLTSFCLAYKNHQVEEYPRPKPKKSLPTQSCYLFLFRHNKKQGSFYLKNIRQWYFRRGLWALPQYSLRVIFNKLRSSIMD